MQQRGKFNWTNILLIFIFMIGLGILLYPNISDYINKRNSSKAVSEYDSTVAQMNQEQRQASLESANSYNSKLSTNSSRFTDMTEDEYEEYMNELNINGEGMMCYLKIDKLGVNLPVYHGTDESVLQHYIGHVEGTSLPVGGIGTHCGLSGHRGLPTAVLFTNLDRMEVGDTFEIYVLGEVHKYVVDQISFVLPDDLSPLAIDPEKDYVTLITCHPYGVNTHRMMVRGVRVPDGTDAGDLVEKEEGENKKKLFDFTREQLVNIIAAVMAGGFFFIGIPLFILIPVRKRIMVLRPWDDNIVEVIDAAVIVSAYATRENWEVSDVAKEADWLASLRRWDDEMGSVPESPQKAEGPQDDLDVIDELDRLEEEEFVPDLMKLDGVPNGVNVYDLLEELKRLDLASDMDPELTPEEQLNNAIEAISNHENNTLQAAKDFGEAPFNESSVKEVAEEDPSMKEAAVKDLSVEEVNEEELNLGEGDQNVANPTAEGSTTGEPNSEVSQQESLGEEDLSDEDSEEEDKVKKVPEKVLTEEEQETFNRITEKVNGKELRDESLLYDKLLITGKYEERPWDDYTYEEEDILTKTVRQAMKEREEADPKIDKKKSKKKVSKTEKQAPPSDNAKWDEEKKEEEYFWDDDILEKVDQDWGKLDPNVQRVALPFIDIKKVLEDKKYGTADEEDKKE